jgi:3-phenylpropionate/trans-cinnamate dioxygenase ferredoxin reductase component
LSARHDTSIIDAESPDRVVIVGAGECGARAALKLRELGFDGSIDLVGDEFDPPYERPGLSKSALTDDEHPQLIARAGQFDELGIAFTPGVGARQIDRDARTVLLVDGREVSYDRLLLATGARARVPAVEGVESVLTLRSLADARALRRRLVAGGRLLVIGGGFIGLEVAASASTLGCSVTVVEYAYQLVSRVVPPAVASRVLARHLAAGVEVRCGVGVYRVEVAAGAYLVQLTDGSTIACDAVVAGVGAIANTRLAAQAGLALDNGIRVDDRLRTDDPRVFAAGDCCSFPHGLYDGERIRLESWRNALDQVEIAAANMLGGDVAYVSVPTFWSDQYEMTIQIAGLYAAGVREVVRQRTDGVEIRFGLDGNGRLRSASGVAVGNALARDIRLAEYLIAEGATPDPDALADPSVPLRSMLR